MYDYLDRHTRIYMSRRKEPRFFGSDLDIKAPYRIQDQNKYINLFSAGAQHQYRGEGTTAYFYSETAPSEILRFSPDAKAIIMLRNPVDMMYSLHGENLWQCYEDIEDFLQALDAEPDRRRGERVSPDAFWPRLLQYRRMASFHAPVRRYLDQFGESVLVVLLDDLRGNPDETWNRVQSFLGVGQEPRPQLKATNIAKPLEARFLMRFWIRHPRLRTLFQRITPADLRRKAAYFLPRLIPGTSRPVRLDPGLRARLLTEMRPEIDKLEAVLGRDLSIWYV